MKLPARFLALFVLISMGVACAQAQGLVDYYRKALQMDPDFAGARASFDGDSRSRDLAKQAFYPSVNLSVSTDQTNYERRDLPPVTTLHPGYNPVSAALRLTQQLYNKDRLAYMRENEVRGLRADWVLALARQDLALRLVQAYFNYLLTLDQITLTEAQAAAIKGQLTQLESLLASRSATRTDVADASAKHDLALVQIRTAQSQLEVRKLEFTKLTGEAPPASVKSMARSPAMTLPDPLNQQAWIDAARENNYKVLVQRTTVQLAEVAIERIRALNYPSVSMSVSRQRATNPNYFTSMERTDNIGIQLNMNLFDGGNTRTQTQQAVAQAERARNDLLSAQHDAAIAAGQAYWGVVNGLEQVKAMEQAEAAAQLALDGTRLGIKANVKTYADELNSVQLLYQTRRDLQKERYGYLLARVQLQLAAGLNQEGLLELIAGLMP